jgi:hypothetical protein
VNQRTFLVRQVEEVGVERGPATLVNHPLLLDREKRAARKRAASRKGTAALASKCSANRMCRASARRLMTTRQRRWCARHFPREKRVEFSTAPSQGPGPTLDLVRSRAWRAAWFAAALSLRVGPLASIGVVSTCRIRERYIGGDEADQPCRPA